LISVGSIVQIYPGPPTDMGYGAVAQLGERQLCKLDVVGSIPIGSTKFLGSLTIAYAQVGSRERKPARSSDLFLAERVVNALDLGLHGMELEQYEER
jgi:hypothetical protein